MLLSMWPAAAERLRVITLIATIPAKSTPSTPIQTRPLVIRTIKLESGSWRTAVAAPAAIGISWPPGRRVGALRRAGALRAGARAGAALSVGGFFRAGALRAGARAGAAALLAVAAAAIRHPPRPARRSSTKHAGG